MILARVACGDAGFVRGQVPRVISGVAVKGLIS